MTSQERTGAPENRTFKLEGWLPIAILAGLLMLGVLAALFVPNFS